MSDPAEADHWRLNGIRIVKAGELDANTAQTPGMNRAAAITHATAGAQKIWAGTVSIHPDAKTGAHHHGHLESVIYVVRGRARMRWVWSRWSTRFSRSRPGTSSSARCCALAGACQRWSRRISA